MRTLHYLKSKILFHSEGLDDEENKPSVKPPRPPPPQRKQNLKQAGELDEQPDLIDLLRFEDCTESDPSTSSMNSSYDAFFDSNITSLPSFVSPGIYEDSISSSYSYMTPQRDASFPSFQQSGGSTLDPFAEFMSSTTHSNPNSGGSSAANTPKQTRPNYSRSAFDSFNSSNASARSKVTPNAFEDLLSGHGFTTSSNTGTPKSMADLQRAEEVKTMDPVQIKMRDWTKGKEKNIRALLGSLNDVLWDGADKWQQPSMAELLQASQIKKWYRKACLVVHPDKQTGTPHEELARAIFTQLNIAWVAHNET